MNIKIEQLKVSNAGSNNKNPLNFELNDNLVIIPYKESLIYDVLLFKFSEIESGSLSIGDKVFSRKSRDTETGLFVLALNIKKVCKLFCVFNAGPNLENTKTRILNTISFHSSEKADTQSDKVKKLTSVLFDLKALGVLYVLFDQNLDENIDNFDLVCQSLGQSLISSVALMKKTDDDLLFEETEPETEEVATPEGTKPDAVEVKGTVEEIKESAPKEAKPYFSVHYSKAKISEIRSMYVFFVTFPLLVSICLAVSAVAVKNGNALRSAITIIISILCFGMHCYNSFTVKSGNNDKMSQLVLEATSSLLTIVGDVIACGIVVLFAKNNILMTMEDFSSAMISLVIIFAIAMAAIPFFAVPARKVFYKIKARFTKAK